MGSLARPCEEEEDLDIISVLRRGPFVTRGCTVLVLVILFNVMVSLLAKKLIIA